MHASQARSGPKCQEQADIFQPLSNLGVDAHFAKQYGTKPRVASLFDHIKVPCYILPRYGQRAAAVIKFNDTMFFDRNGTVKSMRADAVNR